MRNILLHIIDNEDWIVNWVIRGKGRKYKRERKSDEYTSMEQVITHLDKVEQKTKDYFHSIKNQDEFKRRVNFEISSGKVFDPSVDRVPASVIHRTSVSHGRADRASVAEEHRTSTRCNIFGTTPEQVKYSILELIENIGSDRKIDRQPRLRTSVPSIKTNPSLCVLGRQEILQIAQQRSLHLYR